MQALFLWSRPRFGARLVPVRDLVADNQFTHRKVGYASKLSIRRAPWIVDRPDFRNTQLLICA
jgi:hypothetical protein